MVQVLLLTHSLDFSKDEMLLDPELIEELKLVTGDFVEIRALAVDLPAAAAMELQPSTSTTQQQNQPKPGAPLVLRVTSSAPRTRLSVLKSVAEAFGLSARQNVNLQRVERADAELDWVELGFKDQYVTRGDIWVIRGWLERHVVQDSSDGGGCAGSIAPPRQSQRQRASLHLAHVH